MTTHARITAADKRAAEIVAMYEENGKIVRRVIVEGKRVEVEFVDKEASTAPDFVEW